MIRITFFLYDRGLDEIFDRSGVFDVDGGDGVRTGQAEHPGYLG